MSVKSKNENERLFKEAHKIREEVRKTLHDNAKNSCSVRTSSQPGRVMNTSNYPEKSK
jgi:hypothetical protein